MPSDLPDYYGQVETTLTAVTNIKNGLDAAKSASPSVGDVYIATDTYKLYLCTVAGTWTSFDIRLNVVSMSTPSRALDTNYQNGTHIRLVTVSLYMDANADSQVYAFADIDIGTPPSTKYASIACATNLTNSEVRSMTFIVPPSYYYKVETLKITGTITIYYWSEWDLF